MMLLLFTVYARLGCWLLIETDALNNINCNAASNFSNTKLVLYNLEKYRPNFSDRHNVFDVAFCTQNPNLVAASDSNFHRILHFPWQFLLTLLPWFCAYFTSGISHRVLYLCNYLNLYPADSHSDHFYTSRRHYFHLSSPLLTLIIAITTIYHSYHTSTCPLAQQHTHAHHSYWEFRAP